MKISAGKATQVTLLSSSVATGRGVIEADRTPAVNVDNVVKSFGLQRVLNGVSLIVNAGETRAVLGRSGTGKSVLLRMIVGLQYPDSGTVRVFGKDTAGLSLDELAPIRKRMGFL